MPKSIIPNNSVFFNLSQKNNNEIKIENINSIDDIKDFVNKEIFIPLEEMRQDEDAIYWTDLIGCNVIDQNSRLLGKIYKLENHGASDLIFIKTDDEDIIIPLEDQFLGNFELEKNTLNVNWEQIST